MKIKLVSSDDLNWLAGLLEGEGNFALCGKSNNLQPRIQLLMCDLDIVTRAANILGGSSAIVRHKMYVKHWTQSYQYRVFSHQAINWMRLLQPLMGIRRKAKIQEILDFWDSSSRRKPNRNTILPELEKVQSA